MLDRDDLRLVNCAGCNAELHGPVQRAVFLGLGLPLEYAAESGKIRFVSALPDPVHSVLDGRPYCPECAAVETAKPGPSYVVDGREPRKPYAPGDEMLPGQEYALRILEDAE